MTDLLARLPFPPQVDESPRGLVVRIAEDNLCSPLRMADWLGLAGLRNRVSGDPVTMAGLIGVAPDAMLSLGFRADGVETVGAQQISADMVSGWERRYCPACLAGMPYHRRLWEHRQISSCPLHGCGLLDHCPECRSDGVANTAGWGRGLLLTCEAGHRLDLQPAPAANGTLGVAAVHRAFGFQCGGPELHPAFETLPGQALLDVLVFLGRMEVVVVERNQVDIKGREMETHPALLEAGARIAQDWPARFHGLCDRLRVGTKGVTLSAAKRYGYLHRFVRKCNDRPFASILREAYAAELARYEMPEKQWPSFLPLPEPERLLVPASTLFTQKTPNTRAIQERQDAEADGFRPAAVIGRSTYYRRSDIDTLRRESRSLAQPFGGESQSDAARLLGVSPRVMRLMRAAGLLGSAGSQGRTVREINAHLAALVQGGAPADPVTFTDWIRISEHAPLVSSLSLIDAVLSGGIRAWSSGAGSGFAALLFERHEATDLVACLDAAAVGERVRGSELERRAYLPKGSVAMLMDAGLLPPTRASSGYLLRPADVDAFVMAYMSDLEVLRTQGVSRANLHAALEKAEVKPVTVLEAAHRKACSIYRRADVDQFNRVRNG